MDNNKCKDNFKNLKMLRAKLFVSIHIFKTMLQVKNSFKKRCITIKVKKMLQHIIQVMPCLNSVNISLSS